MAIIEGEYGRKPPATRARRRGRRHRRRRRHHLPLPAGGGRPPRRGIPGERALRLAAGRLQRDGPAIRSRGLGQEEAARAGSSHRRLLPD